WEYFGYTRRQYRRIRELDAFLRRVAAPLLDETGLGLRLRFLSGGLSPAARLVGGKVLPERSAYYHGLRLVESDLAAPGLPSTLRRAVQVSTASIRFPYELPAVAGPRGSRVSTRHAAPTPHW